MKKICFKLLVLSFAALAFSCTHDGEQRVALNFDFNRGESVFSEKKYELELRVVDDRKHRDSIGSKQLGEEKIVIVSETNLVNTIKTRLAQGLENRGFYTGSGKVVELHINVLEYKAKRQFFIGTSEMKSEMTVSVKDPKNKVEFNKDYKLSVQNKHFLVPLKSTDDETINFVVKETLNDMLGDNELLDELKK